MWKQHNWSSTCHTIAMQSNCRKKNISDVYFVIRYILAGNDRNSDIYVYYVTEY